MKKNTRIKCVCLIVSLIFFEFLWIVDSDAAQEKDLDKLETLGYLTWVPAGDSLKKRGVTRYIQEESFSGLNLYNSRDGSTAILMDMRGKVLHRWRNPVRGSGSWQHVEICPNGDLLVIQKDRALIRLDWDSRIKWEKPLRFHHDAALGENGDIFALSRRDRFVIHRGWIYPVIVDTIVVLTGDGKIRNEIPIFPLVEDLISPVHFRRLYRWLGEVRNHRRLDSIRKKGGIGFPQPSPADILHTNTLEWIPRRIAGLCEKGDFLVSFRTLDMIGIIDRDLKGLRWSWGPGVLQKQHQPVLLENNHILIFDNGGHNRRYSRILEINPLKGRIVWEYRARPPESFFSVSRGGNQRLPNGNTLITESDRGRVFEVTPDGKITWEFYNPRVRKDNKTRAAIYRLRRIWDKSRYPFLNHFFQELNSLSH